MSVDISELNEKIARDSAFISALRNEVSKAIVGQNHMVDSLLIGLLAKGHILLEGVPGLAKTLAINTLSKALVRCIGHRRLCYQQKDGVSK